MSVDTLTLAQRLRAAELPANQAEAIAAAIGAAVLEGAATKDDVIAAKTELKADIAAVKAELKADFAGLELKIEQLRTEMERGTGQLFVRMVGTQSALAGLIVAAIKLL